MNDNLNKFRKATFGGFNRKDVVDYIEKIQNEFYDYKKETESTVKKLNEKIAELEALVDAESAVGSTDQIEVEQSTVADSECTEPANEINAATTKLKNVTDELCKSMSDFIDRLSENTISLTIDIPCEQEIASEEESFVDEGISEEIPTDKVQKILSAVGSIFSDKAESEKTKDAKDQNATGASKSVADILSSAGFIC